MPRPVVSHIDLWGLIAPSPGFLWPYGQGILALRLPLGQAGLGGAWGVLAESGKRGSVPKEGR